MIRRVMIIINVSSEAISTNTSASVELKYVSALPVKLNLALVNWSYTFYWLNVGQYSFYNKEILVEI